MIIFPYSTALSLSKPSVVTYITAFLCLLVFYFQLTTPITESLMYYPHSWNPLAMVTASMAHGSWMHLLGNLIFFLAFAPALEALIGNRLLYISSMVFISLVVGVSYSISTILGSSEPLPTLGLSGVVMGMIGLSAFLMPKAQIRVFGWFIIFWKTFYIPAWILAVFYIGLDSWEMLTAKDYGGINVVAHVAGGFAGYVFGFFWLKQRKEDTEEELAEEIEVMKMEKKHLQSSGSSYRRIKELEQQHLDREAAKQQDRFMSQMYQAVSTHRDSEAIALLMDRYDYFKHPCKQFELLFNHIENWGPSRTLLCMGRLVIYLLNEERRYARALYYIERCQQLSPLFILPELKQTVYYAKLAIELEKPEVARNLISNAAKRYDGLVNVELCKQLEEQL